MKLKLEMEKDIGKIKKNETTAIVIRIDDYKGKKGLTIREYITSEKYTGFSKSGTRIPADEFLNFREMINSISLDELTSAKKEVKKEKESDKIESKEEQEEEKDEEAEEDKESGEESEEEPEEDEAE